MTKALMLGFLCLFLSTTGIAQSFQLPLVNTTDSLQLAQSMQTLATNVLAVYQPQTDQKAFFDTRFRLQLVAGQYAEARKSIMAVRSLSTDSLAELLYKQYELFAGARLSQLKDGGSFAAHAKPLLSTLFAGLTDRRALAISTAFVSRNGVASLQNDFATLLAKYKTDNLDFAEAIALCTSYNTWQVYRQIEEVARPVVKADDAHRFIIDDSVLIKTKEGAILSAVVVRKRGITTPQPTALMFFIYSNTDRSLAEAKYSATRGYVGMVADTRGKRLSPDPIKPYEHEARDVNSVIDWIVAQPWSNGKVGMYGGSYSGFAQWAALKYPHPALKTIVPYVAAIPGQGLPMENNVFLNANYQWAFYVTNTKYLDNEANNDNQRWRRMRNRWYESGAAYNRIDSIDGTPNPWLQRWLKHPDYDAYWQNMVPYGPEFSKIKIPILSITGYYDDGQISAMQYVTEHYKYNPTAEHYLLIGPYDHFGAQQGGVPVLRDYQVDPIALINTRKITFDWLDYSLKGAEKPALLTDKINYEVMGSNTWAHAPSLAEVSKTSLRLYLTNQKEGANYRLSKQRPTTAKTLKQVVNLADRTTSNNDYYPDPIIRKTLNRTNGLFFISDPFEQEAAVSGMFSGELKAMINKKDMDIGVVLYEVTPQGEYFALSYFLGRASYARDASRRQLLRPGAWETIPFSKTRFVSRKVSKGSRLLVVLNIDKNSFAQINYGTGKDVSQETIKDAGKPLTIQWSTDSYIQIPIQIDR
ncbi:CocE/NonD family hydrolase [Spirosoma litoris]